MLRPLVTLAAGVLLAIAAGVAIAPTSSWREALLPVLITGGLGAIVLAVTARRATLRDKAEALAASTTPDFIDTSRTDGEEPDRG